MAEQALYRWSFGVYGCEFQRRAEIKSSNYPITLETSKIMGYIGFDLAPALTVYVTAGQNDTSVKGYSWLDADPEFEYGAGFRLHLLDHEIPDPTLFENRIRLTAGAQYTVTESKTRFYQWDWSDVLGYLTLSVVNDIEGNALYLPNSIAFYVGAVYTTLVSGDLEQKHDSDFGFSGGVEVYYSECISFDLGVLQVEETGYMAGLHVRF